MKERHELKNYRKKYERFYCEEIPEGYEVHHLDMNRGNSRISNLIAIPKELHRRYRETIMQRPVESGISEIFLQNM